MVVSNLILICISLLLLLTVSRRCNLCMDRKQDSPRFHYTVHLQVAHDLFLIYICHPDRHLEHLDNLTYGTQHLHRVCPILCHTLRPSFLGGKLLHGHFLSSTHLPDARLFLGEKCYCLYIIYYYILYYIIIIIIIIVNFNNN